MNYRFAVSPADYRKCHSLMGEEKTPLSFPTVMAEEDDGEIVGFLGTHSKKDHKGAVIAGPLVLKDKRPIVAFRLCEKYELLMRVLGVLFFFYTKDPSLAEQFKKIGCILFREDEGLFWFKNREVG